MKRVAPSRFRRRRSSPRRGLDDAPGERAAAPAARRARALALALALASLRTLLIEPFPHPVTESMLPTLCGPATGSS